MFAWYNWQHKSTNPRLLLGVKLFAAADIVLGLALVMCHRSQVSALRKDKTD